MTRLLLARLLLVVALLGAWQSALVHPIEHVDEHGYLVHGGEPSSEPEDKLCDALGALTALAPASSPFAQHSAALAVAARIAVATLPADAVPFLSQGPPSLL